MKIKAIKCNVTYAFQLSIKDFLKWDSLSENHDLFAIMKAGIESYIDMTWDVGTGGGPNIFVTVEDEQEIPLVTQRIQFILENL